MGSHTAETDESEKGFERFRRRIIDVKDESDSDLSELGGDSDSVDTLPSDNNHSDQQGSGVSSESEGGNDTPRASKFVRPKSLPQVRACGRDHMDAVTLAEDGNTPYGYTFMQILSGCQQHRHTTITCSRAFPRQRVKRQMNSCYRQ